MAVKNYKKGSGTKLSANFRVSEFDCNGSGCCSTTKIDDKLVSYLQKIRDHFGAPVTLASGYRCETHNAKVANAASKSRHISGMAADIKVKGVAPAEVAKYAESIGVKGIGLYDTDKDGHFVHIDTRDTKSFWFGHAQERRTTFGGAPKDELEVTGKWDKATTTRLQKIFGTPVDGIVSNQHSRYKASNPGLTSGWDWDDKPSKSGSTLIKAMQKWAGMSSKDQDGKIGPNTISALQKKLGTPVDGKVSLPSQMVKALQSWANAQ